jgi:hypothetical protein
MGAIYELPLRNHLRIISYGQRLYEIPPAPLVKGGEFSSSPFTRGIEGDPDNS